MHNNNQLKLKDYKRSFLKCSAGNVMLSMAIIFPVMIICMLVAIIHTKTLESRARFSEAANEAALAIVALDNKSAPGDPYKQNYFFAIHYTNYFINDRITKEQVGLAPYARVSYKEDTDEYRVTYSQLYSNDLPGIINGTTMLTNYVETYGNTTKSHTPDSVAIAFISDFSGSTTCPYGGSYEGSKDGGCNDYVEDVEEGKRRVDYMKSAMEGIIDKYKDYPEFHFALVPYDIGVPVVSDGIYNVETENPAGGESYACSVMYKLKEPYDSVDYNFWANKNIAYAKWSKLKQSNHIVFYLTYPYFTYFKNVVYYYLDYYNYLYYSKIIGPAKGLNSDEALVDGGLCAKRHNIEQMHMGSTRYACGANESDYALRPENRKTIESQYGKIVQLYDYMFSGNYPNVHYSFANTETVDVSGTIDTLFSNMDSNIINFNRPIAPTIADFSPFQGMCQSPLFSNDIMNRSIIKASNPKRLKEASRKISSFKLAPHLIPFSNDTDHNIKILESIKSQEWKPGGGTDTMTALLRAVPVMAKGDTSNNKIMIIISDGDDDVGAGVLRDKFLDNDVCQKITEGLTSKQNQKNGYIDKAAKSAVIYYIKLNPVADIIKSDAEYERMYGKWFTKCMNGKKTLLYGATDYQSLSEAINRIIQVETGNFVNRHDISNKK
ncbi:TadE/TadG family type IV pilus assembly protein [Gilliamella mensalis]|uniref:TadE/TadG family type IV pilus assembly protein n=1 Tax=Gilliamella mensalis TaxID=1908520 RepID=UPI00117A3983|nr:TadE/TadG family type IV pilus assembly protein [Gilliamella mensalis]